MVSILIAVADAEVDFVIADLLDSGTLGCMEESGGVRAYFADRGHVAALNLRYPIAEIRDESEAAGAPLVAAEPVMAGQRFLIVPPGAELDAGSDRLRLEVEAGAAFGSGRHESTQLMLGSLERIMHPKMIVADIGCGSGILSQAALLLGADQVVACDIDPVFLSAAPAVLRSRVFVGSADAIRTGSIDLVLANISAKVIDLIAYDLNRIARPDAWIVLAGFIRDRVPSQFTPVEAAEQGDWLCWLCRRGQLEPTSPIAHSLEWY